MALQQAVQLVVVCLTVSICHGVKMNVLFLVSDDMRPDIGAYRDPDIHTSFHPKMVTPNLDKLASRSLLLKKAYVQQAVCSPSRTSVLTGRRPDTTHVYDLTDYFRVVGGNFTTIPQYFKQHGYASIGMGKIFHPGEASGDNDPISWSEPYYPGKSKYWNKFHESWMKVNDSILRKHPLPDSIVADHAVETLKRIAPKAKTGEQPFFLAVGFHKPHLPFVFPDKFWSMYPEQDIKLPSNPYAPVNMPELAWSNFDELRKYNDMRSMGHGSINTTLPDKVVLNLRRAYYSAISYTDSLVGQVIDELDRQGLGNSTVISFWGDHGWQLGEHAEWCKHTNFDLSTHAPMMVRVPGKTDSGIVTEAFTEFVDLFPSLVELTGLPALPLCPSDTSTSPAACREGTSFVPLLSNPGREWKNAAFSQYPRMAIDGNIYMGYTMRTTRYRYTEWVEFHSWPTWTPRWDKIHHSTDGELYDHSLDPDENVNRYSDPSYASVIAQLAKQLRDGWRHSLPPKYL